MKKFFLLIIVVILALAIDGTLARDIFDYRIDSPSQWLGLILILIILGVIAWGESDKKT